MLRAVKIPKRDAEFKAVQGGALLSFDSNLRPPLWGSLEDTRAQISYGLAHCDIPKIADNEL